MARILKLDAAFASGEEERPSRRVAGEVYDATQRARDVLAAAQTEAERLRSEVEAERERARAEGVESGRQEGLAQAGRLLVCAALERDRLLAAAEREVVRLSLAVAEKILGREVARASPVVEMAARALEEVRRSRVVLLRVHPDDANRLRDGRERLAAIVFRAPGIALHEDDAVSQGGVVVETEAGTIDARLEVQLEALESALADVGSE